MEGAVDHGEPVTMVLLVEDEPLVLRLGRAVLERSGYAVLPAGTPAEALTVAGSHPGDIHLLITDVVMPEMQGRELADRLTRMRPGIRTLFVSGYAAGHLTPTGALAPGVHFLQKPFSVDQLTASVAAVLRAPG
jgi:two-component system cell cycle sensor histidine kinase/response regulator CckA